MSTAIICAVLIVIAIIGIKSYAKKINLRVLRGLLPAIGEKNESQG